MPMASLCWRRTESTCVACLRTTLLTAAEADAKRSAAVGNGWHIPTVLTLAVLLLVQHFSPMVAATSQRHEVFNFTTQPHEVFNFIAQLSPPEQWMQRWWADALSRLDVEMPGSILDATWHRIRAVQLDYVLRGPTGGLDLAALRPKQFLPQGPIQGGIHSHLVPELDSMDMHAEWATKLDHPAGTAPEIEHVLCIDQSIPCCFPFWSTPYARLG